VARDRQRAKQRKARRAQNPGPARSKLERARTGALSPELTESPLATGNDVREIAARLAAVPASASNDLLQQMLIVFSLAADRLSDLERRGMATRAPRRVTTAG